MSELAIRATGLAKAYRIGKLQQQVLKDVDFHARAGELMAQCESLRTKKARLVDRFRLDHCGFIFQGFNLFSALDATRQVVPVLRYCGLGWRVAQARSIEALESVGLGARLR
jgi:putative ABC transport system ATP-binding protein